MIRLALILTLLAAPALAQTVPLPRPDDLVERNADAAERAVDVPVPMGSEAPAQAAAEPSMDRAQVAAQIAGAIRNCWNVGDLSEEAMAVRITVAFNTTPEGEVIRDTIDMTEFSNGTQEAADEALGAAFRAIMRCAATGLDLPLDTYPIWQRVEMRFDASATVLR